MTPVTEHRAAALLDLDRIRRAWRVGQNVLTNLAATIVPNDPSFTGTAVIGFPDIDCHNPAGLSWVGMSVAEFESGRIVTDGGKQRIRRRVQAIPTFVPRIMDPRVISTVLAAPVVRVLETRRTYLGVVLDRSSGLGEFWTLPTVDASNSIQGTSAGYEAVLPDQPMLKTLLTGLNPAHAAVDPNTLLDDVPLAFYVATGTFVRDPANSAEAILTVAAGFELERGEQLRAVADDDPNGIRWLDVTPEGPAPLSTKLRWTSRYFGFGPLFKPSTPQCSASRSAADNLAMIIESAESTRGLGRVVDPWEKLKKPWRLTNGVPQWVFEAA